VEILGKPGGLFNIKLDFLYSESRILIPGNEVCPFALSSEVPQEIVSAQRWTTLASKYL
jgi:hypothetical protein